MAAAYRPRHPRVAPGAYILFYDLTKQEQSQYLLCRSYKGLKDDNFYRDPLLPVDHFYSSSRPKNEYRIYCNILRGGPQDPNEIIRRKDLILGRLRDIHPYARLKYFNENSMIFIDKTRDSYFKNLIGGKIKEGETYVNAALREFKEEILLNFEPLVQNSLIENLRPLLIDTMRVLSEDDVIYLVDFNRLNDALQVHINTLIASADHDNNGYIVGLSRLGTECGVDNVETGELHSIKWTNLDSVSKIQERQVKDIIAKEEEPAARLVPRYRRSGGYYKEYLKYKQKYLALKAQLRR